MNLSKNRFWRKIVFILIINHLAILAGTDLKYGELQQKTKDFKSRNLQITNHKRNCHSVSTLESFYKLRVRGKWRSATDDNENIFWISYVNISGSSWWFDNLFWMSYINIFVSSWWSLMMYQQFWLFYISLIIIKFTSLSFLVQI